jgi:hypothetical protein
MPEAKMLYRFHSQMQVFFEPIKVSTSSPGADIRNLFVRTGIWQQFSHCF